MRVLILADERQKEGGNNEIIKHLTSALYDHKIQVKYINISNNTMIFFGIHLNKRKEYEKKLYIYY